ncbi:MAG: DUF2007 domain-containing protein [Bacteroidaceae bacterium]|jgi:hypothetical protein|nr:DUF2007 domain-containing protein [Bacteroidaceae bacterium]
MLEEEKMVVVKTCNELFEAELVVGRLKAEGISSAIRDRSTGVTIYTSPYAFPSIFDVEVLEHDKAAAEAVLAETVESEE